VISGTILARIEVVDARHALQREIHPPTLRFEATVCAVTGDDITKLTAAAVVA
jgi:hypothetical protein